MSQFDITKLRPSEHANCSDAIEKEMLAALALANVQSSNISIVLALRDDDGSLLGGLTASTSYGWLLIKTLWVAEELRGHGQGRALMDRAEAEGRAIGVHSVWLDTSSSMARTFYENLGYEEFGVLQNSPHQNPNGHCRWFMKKTL